MMGRIGISSRKRKFARELSSASKLYPESSEDEGRGNTNKKTAPKLKVKREPLPMKMRAFPSSFWQEPNASGIVLPTSYYAPMEEENEGSCHSHVGKANTDLLFSLFRNVQGESDEDRQAPVVKRGRPRKLKPNKVVKTAKDDDPYFTSAIVPVIRVKEEEKRKAQEQQVLALISVNGENDSLPINASYTERLSDLVVNL